MMIIRVRSRDGLERVTTYNPVITVFDLKTVIEEQLNVPIYNQALSLNQNLLLSKTLEDMYRFADMSNLFTPISSLGISHGSMIFLAYVGERLVAGPLIYPAGSFGQKMTVDDLVAKERMRVVEQEKPHYEPVLFCQDDPNIFENYVNSLASIVQGRVHL
ncbi:hypothetical protein GIB67_034461 [Kingdonia uniflora]|uniref:Ubiquitin-like domain-containing protein n=1 Tax=Kingdonia uniflora TaxID=39325 RepID=A0A7J7PAZ2_9MAGN|nr:hypothetical protein GIB67_034461 [Kingdonia uniflora]